MDKKYFYDQALSTGVSQTTIEKILCKILGCSREHLFLISDIPAKHLYEFQDYLYQFQNGVPEAYILGEQAFYGRNFRCERATLIPRQETELLVDVLKDVCLKRADMRESSYIDIGTGTACILATLLLELQPLRFRQAYGVDISDDILELSQKNITQLALSEVKLVKSSLLDAFLSDKNMQLSQTLYLSANLPYIKRGDEQSMGSEVLAYEPENALYGGTTTGFELYEALLKQCFLLKKIRGLRDIHLCIEIGYDQYEYSKHFLEELGLRFEYFQDIHTIERIIYITGF